MSSRDRATKIVNAAIEEVNQLRAKNRKINPETETVLMGNSGVLDSLGLVNLMVAVEEIAEDEYDISLTLGQESSVAAQQKIFASVGSLIDHIASMIEEG